MRKTILSLVVLCWIWKASAQEEPAKKDTWQFSLSSGVSAPLGSFARHDAAGAIIYNPDDNNAHPNIIGINKSKDGFAKTGYYYSAKVSLLTKQGIVLALHGGRNLNGHRTNELQTFINDHYNYTGLPDYPFYADDYSIGYLLPGIGYGWSKGSWQIQALMMAGVARCNYPFYKRDNVSNTEWRPLKPWPTLHAFAWGGSVTAARSFGKHFFLQADLSYLQSNFGYYIQNLLYPVGNPFPSFVDKIKWKVLQSGLSVGFKW